MDHRGQQSDSSQPVENLRIKGDDTIINVVQAFEEKKREWLVGQPVCELLAQYYINHAGVMHAQYPLEISRADQSGTFMLACFAGEGRVLADGKWFERPTG